MNKNILSIFWLLGILIIVSLSACALPLIKQSVAPTSSVNKTIPAMETKGIRFESLTPIPQEASVEHPTQTFPAVPQSSATKELATPTNTATPVAPTVAIAVVTDTPTAVPSPTPTTAAPSPTSATELSASSSLKVLPPADLPLPTTYTLQKSEFPFCIARRFNVDQNELMHLNNLHYYGQFFYSGLVLKMPQTGHHFDGTRALHAHTQSYTVIRSNETVRSVACYFGDIDPQTIADINHLDVNAKLVIGQVLQLTK